MGAGKICAPAESKAKWGWALLGHKRFTLGKMGGTNEVEHTFWAQIGNKILPGHNCCKQSGDMDKIGAQCEEKEGFN